ncbi:hypothetical protein [Bradyrhizobium diazoefficiens]
MDHCRTVIVPTNGIGTALSRLPKYAPNLDAFIKEWFRSRL